MDRQAFLAQLDEILELPSGTLTGSENLSDLDNWDSLAVMNFIALASDRYGATLSPRQIASCHSVEDLLTLAGPKK
jgi:acyl carrier protein